jgi:hypothetical protein
MIDDLPPLPPGYRQSEGKRRPPKSWGERVYVQLRNGTCPAESWAISTTDWIWRGDGFDVVAARKA